MFFIKDGCLKFLKVNDVHFVADGAAVIATYSSLSRDIKLLFHYSSFFDQNGPNGPTDLWFILQMS